MKRQFNVEFKALSPLSHGAFEDGVDTGNASRFRREPIVSLKGYPRVPVVSGNSIRGKLRRLLMGELFERVNISDFVEHFGDTKSRRAWDRLYAALCTGGTIEQAETNINPVALRELRAEFPALSVLGSALYTQLMYGMVDIGFAWPLCAETIAAGLWHNVDDVHIPPAEELLTEVGLVRHIDREKSDPDVSGVKPMPYTVEGLATGTRLKAIITLKPQTTDIEIAAIVHGLKMIGTLGGKSGAGFGMVEVTISQEADDSPYINWLQVTDIKSLLIKMAERLI